MKLLSISHSLLVSMYLGTEIRYHISIPLSTWTEYVMNNHSNNYNSVAFRNDKSAIILKYNEARQTITVYAAKDFRIDEFQFRRGGYVMVSLITYEENTDFTVTLSVKLKRDIILIIFTLIMFFGVGNTLYGAFLEERLLSELYKAFFFMGFFFVFYSIVFGRSRVWFVHVIEKWFEHLEKEHSDTSQIL
jgi:hypothetical protein